MSENNLQPETMRPEELMLELGIKKTAFYEDLKYLRLELDKDSQGRTYLTKEQADLMRELRKHVIDNGQRVGFDQELDRASAMVKAESNSLSQQDIYVQPEDPQDNLDIDQLMREAAELKAREIAMPNLVKRAVADKMTEEDLPEDLREKVEAVREAVNPKWTPEGIADNLLSQWRKKRAS